MLDIALIAHDQPPITFHPRNAALHLPAVDSSTCSLTACQLWETDVRIGGNPMAAAMFTGTRPLLFGVPAMRRPPQPPIYLGKRNCSWKRSCHSADKSGRSTL